VKIAKSELIEKMQTL